MALFDEDPSQNPGNMPELQRAGVGRDKDKFYKSLFQNAQLALINMIDRVGSFNQRFTVAQKYLKNDAAVQTATSLQNDYPIARTGYRTVVPVQAINPQEPDLLVSKIAGKRNIVNDFMTFKLSSAQQAMLVPMIRVYKMEYNTEGDGVTTPVRPTTVKRQIEIEFDGVTRTSDVLSILEDRKGKLSGTGIESFEWALKGVNPGEIDNNIEASLRIYFNNVSDIFKDRMRNRVEGAGIEGKASFLDLVVFAPATTATAGALGHCPEKFYDGKFFEIRVDVGWATPETQDPAAGSPLFSEKEITYIKEQRESLFLQLTDHAFEFEEDGSATLTANYRARFSLTDERYDILRLDDDESIKQHIENLKKLQSVESPTETQKEQLKEDEKAYDELLQEKYRNIVEELVTKHVYSTYVPPALLLIGSNTAGDPLRIPDNTYDPTDLDTVYDIKDYNDALFSSPGAAYNKDFYDNVIEPLRDAYIAASNNINIQGPGTLGAIYAGQQNARQQFINSTFDEENSVISSGGAQRTRQRRDELAPAPGVKIDFFYLGDILEVFFTQPAILKEIAAKQLGFILTDIEFVNPRKIYHLLEKMTSAGKKPVMGPHSKAAIEIRKIKCGFSGLRPQQRRKYLSSTNIANIPITVELFLDFMKRKIIGEQKVNYYLEDFIVDIVNSFVKPIFLQNSIVGTPPNAPISTVTTVETNNAIPFFSEDHEIGYQAPPPHATVQSHVLEAKMFPDVWKHRDDPSDPKFDKTYTIRGDIAHFFGKLPATTGIKIGSSNAPPQRKAFTSPISSVPPIDPDDDSANSKNAATAASIKIISFQNYYAAYNGVYADNTQKGIPNFVVGLDRGIIKAVNFERVDQPYLREARTAKSRSSGISQLRELYNVNLVLYGNNLLKPGQIIYVEPNQMIFGRPTTERSVSRLLGMGGYHLVVDVANQIASDGWETEVQALHVAMPALPEK